MRNWHDSHCSVVHFIRKFYAEVIIVGGLAELQDTCTPAKKITICWRDTGKHFPPLPIKHTISVSVEIQEEQLKLSQARYQLTT